jgi:ABC-type uncharacterized transport system
MALEPSTTTGPSSRAATPVRALGPSGAWSALYASGMVLIFLGERIIGNGTGRVAATVLGVLALLVALTARIVRGARVARDRAAVEKRFTTMYGLGLVAVGLYFLQSDLPTLRGGTALEVTWPRLATVIGAVWPTLWAAALFAILPMELAYAPMARAPQVEDLRVRAAQFSGMGMAFMLTFAFSLCYAASERDKKVDLAYFRTTRPGESTRKIVRSLDQPLTVAMFFPKGNEVREEVDNYFSDLARESGQLKVERYDHDIDPAKAKDLGASANGIVVFVRGARKEQLALQTTMENARSGLKTLDREVQQRLLQVVKPNRITYFTQGHGERTANSLGDADRRPGVRDLRAALVDQGHEVRDLGPAEGLATDVPKEATLVMIIGPTKPFLPEEIGALQRFLDRGGRLFVALDPDGGIDLHELLEPTGLKVPLVQLANDQVFGRRTHQDSDRANLVTASYSSHPSVSTLSRESRNAPVVLPGAAAVEAPTRAAHKDYTIDFPLHAHIATFADTNGNFSFDNGETRKAWDLAAAVTRKISKTTPPTGKDAAAKKDTAKDASKDAPKDEERLFVIGDSDFLTDPVIRFGGNGLLVLDPLRWLIGEESFAGMVSTEADVPISHTRKQDVAWFYSTIFVVPGLVLGAGLLVTRRRRKGRVGAPAAGVAGGVS